MLAFDRRSSFNRRHVMHLLGLDGTGALRTTRIRGAVRVKRGGIWVTAYHDPKRPRPL
jgi:hypothetical protein